MIQSGALSRRPNLHPEDDNDNKNITMLSKDLFISLIDTKLQHEILNSKEMDTEAAEAIKMMLEDGPTQLRNDISDWKMETYSDTTLLFYKDKNYIPKNQDLHRK